MKIKELFRKSGNILLALSGAILVFLSYPEFSLWPLAWVALIPFFVSVLSVKSPLEAVFTGIISGFFFYSLLLWWLVPTMAAGGVVWPLRVLALFLLSLMLSVEFIVVFFVGHGVARLGQMASAMVTASVWVLVEFAKINACKVLVWFPWFILGYTQWNNPAALGIAAYGKVYAVSFLMVFAQCFIAGFFIYKNSVKSAAVKIFFLLAVLISAFYCGRMYGLSVTHQPGSEIKVAILQPSIDIYKKWEPGYVDSIKSRLEKLVLRAAGEKPDLVVWPENALPGWIDDKDIFKWFSNLAKRTNSFHIVGSVSRGDGRFVSAFLVSPEGEIKSEYDKRVLVPFGEYVPLRGLLGKYISAVGTLGEFDPGAKDQELFEIRHAGTSTVKIGISICYESLFSYLFFDQLRRRPDFFVNITNDGWYLDTSAPYQHLAAAVFRAAETGKPLVRAANNGISAFISPSGKIESFLALNEYGILTGSVPSPGMERKPFFVGNNWALYLSVMIIVAFLFAFLLTQI